MYCWKCGKEIQADVAFCVFCGANQKSAATAATKPGAVLRQTFLKLGSQALTDSQTLPNALTEALPDEKILALRLRMALDAGVGQIYLDQMSRGKPGSDFAGKVKSILTDKVGLGDKPARNVMECLDEMMGWSVPTEQAASQKAEPPRQEPAPQRTYASASQQKASYQSGSASAMPSVASTTPAEEPEEKKRTWKDFLFLPLVAVFVFLGIDNMNNMNNGEMYIIWYEIPAHYVLFVGAAFFLIAGIASLSKKGK